MPRKMKKSTKSTEVKLNKLIPFEQQQVTKNNLKQVVKNTESNKLAENYYRLSNFFNTFYEIVEQEFLSRLKKLRKETKQSTIKTDIGNITFVVRNNYTFDEKKILKFLLRHKIPANQLFDKKYNVVTENERVLKELVNKGHISEVKVVNVSKFTELVKEYPELLDYVENNPTEYIKGL